jgi:hypothetical protein
LYSTCIFCHSGLGKNEAIEHFPVGRRLAFDGAKGRLWVVCAKCGRWNLTPLEERWEAIEECEKQYRGTFTRSSTDEIGLGRIREGTDLIRIGQPLRPEFAAWRYGRQFQQRKRRAQVYGTLGIVAQIGLKVTLTPYVPAITFGAWVIGYFAMKKTEAAKAQRLIAQKAGAVYGRKIWKKNSVEVRIIPSDHEQGWALRFALDGKYADYHGREALHIAQLVAPSINSRGGSADDVRIAVRDIEIAGSAERYFPRVLNYGQKHGWQYTGLGGYPDHMRLAFEMAAHEENERAALEGELKRLEDDWREAEEIAAIADNLFLPRAITDFVERHRPGAKT